MLGPYAIEHRLGGGGMGTVYRARHRESGELVALKVLRPELLGNERARARFVREGAIAKQLRHPNLCRVLDVGQDGERSI